jgi:hypothetical protein
MNNLVLYRSEKFNNVEYNLWRNENKENKYVNKSKINI